MHQVARRRRAECATPSLSAVSFAETSLFGGLTFTRPGFVGQSGKSNVNTSAPHCTINCWLSKVVHTCIGCLHSSMHPSGSLHDHRSLRQSNMQREPDKRMCLASGPYARCRYPSNYDAIAALAVHNVFHTHRLTAKASCSTTLVKWIAGACAYSVSMQVLGSLLNRCRAFPHEAPALRRLNNQSKAWVISDICNCVCMTPRPALRRRPGPTPLAGPTSADSALL